MGIFLLLILVIVAISWFISRAVYVRQVKNDYKSPGITAAIVFLLSVAILAGGILLLVINAFNFSRH